MSIEVRMKERLQKLISQAGIASRRAAERLILEGKVSVNGKVVRELGTKADPANDHIKVGGKLINPRLEQRQDTYILLNKPKGYLSSVSDPEGRPVVTDLVPAKYGKLYPVGRLDFKTEGLIILTNDGKFANKVASTRTIPKRYEVKVKGIPPENAIEKLRRGITLEDGFRTAPAEIKALRTTKTNAWFEVVLYEGHNQQIRKMFDEINFSAVKLKRTAIGRVRLRSLASGAFREMDKQEVEEFRTYDKPSPRRRTR